MALAASWQVEGNNIYRVAFNLPGRSACYVCGSIQLGGQLIRKRGNGADEAPMRAPMALY